MQRNASRLRQFLLSAFMMTATVAFIADVAYAPSAQAKRKKRKKSSKSKKSSNDKKADGPAPSEELRSTGPATLALPLKEKDFDNSQKADKKRDEQIAEIRELLPKTKGATKGELIFRLAEAYWAKSRYVYFKEFKEYDAKYSDWVDNGRAGKEPKLNDFLIKSEAYKKQALKNYQVVLDKYPDYPRLDEVLYIMAYNEYQAGKKKPAVKNYSKLIKRYPDSEYVPDSYLALGEHYFAKNDLRRCEAAYKKAFSIGKKRNRPDTWIYAYYKLAWVDYNKQEFEGALKKFKGVIANAEKSKKDDAGIRLKREALNDMVLTYSQLDIVDDAYDYFVKKSDRDEAYRLTTKLAGLYNKDGKHKLEIQTYRFILSKDPDNLNAPDYQANIVQAYSTLGDYRPGGPWARKNQGNETAVERARTLAENKMRQLVTEYHEYAQKFKKVSDYTLARDIYKEYLQAFPDSDDAYNLSFYYAEILWDLDQWREAAAQYDRVVKKDPKGKYTRDSAWNSILAWEKIVKKEKARVLKEGDVLRAKKKGKAGRRGSRRKETIVLKQAKKGQKDKFEPQKIPEDEVALATACDSYVAVVPESLSKKDKKLRDELIVVKFKSASIYNKYFHWDEAAERFGELINRWPDNKYARMGADSILDSYDAREEWENLEKWSRDFAKKKDLMKEKKFASQVAKFMEGASFKSIQRVYDAAAKIEKKSPKDAETQFASAADRFNGFVKEFPKSQFAAIARYNTQIIYKKANKIDLAIDSAEDLLKTYSKEILEGELGNANVERTTILNLAAYNNQVADYAKAAEWYEKFIAKWKSDKEAPDALFDSATFRLGLGDTKAAIAGFTKYINDYPKQKDRAKVYLRIASIYEDNENYKTAAQMYGAFSDPKNKLTKGAKKTKEQELLARYKHSTMLEKAGRIDDMRKECQGILSGYKTYQKRVTDKDLLSLAGGYCAFQVLEPEWQKYKAIKIVAKGKGAKRQMKSVRDALEAKKKGMGAIAKKYKAILDYGNGEWGVAGLYRGAEALLEYVDSLRNAPDPPPLKNNFEALDLFRAEIDNIAFPVEDEAIKVLEESLKTAFRLGIYSSYTLAIEDRLRLFKPSAFGNIHELPFFPSTGEGAPTRTASR
jgi:TolA-binding protein